METLLAELRAIVARPLMTPAEAAAFLSVSEEHLFAMRRERRGLPFPGDPSEGGALLP